MSGLAGVRCDFPDLGDLAYLDTASKAVPPAHAVEALRREVAAWAAGTASSEAWSEAAERARGHVARMLGRESRDVAVLTSHVAAAGTVARAFPDAAVVVPEQEFRSNLLPWLHGRDRVRLVPAPATTEAICAAIDAGTDLVAVSSVQSADGLRVDLPRIVAHAHRHGALVHVDASQSFGVDATLRDCGADFIGAVAYKWLLGARGAAFLAVRPEHRGAIPPLTLAPGGVTDGSMYGPEYAPWDDARRFDQPPAWLSWIATAAGLDVLSRYDTAELDAHATRLSGRFRSGVRDLGLTPSPSDVPSAIVRAAHPAPDAAVTALAEAGVRAAARDGALRFAFHLYTTEADVYRALTTLSSLRT